jgi:beta-mannosidase
MEKISLDGEWILKNSQRDIEISAEIPGSVFETLIKNNIIEDPFYGLNEDKVSWVYNSNWEYYIDFDIPANFLNYSNIILRFYGLDTLAIISLNDKIIGSAENMFLYYDFNVNSILKSTSNILKVVFKSPTINAEEEIKKLGINLNTGETAIQGVPYLRKAQYSFGWDWGPKLPDIGIWKSVELIGFDNLKISSIYPIQRFEYFVDPLKIEDLNDITINGVKSVNLLLKIEINSEISDISSLNYRLKVDLKAPDGILFNREIPLDSINLSVEFQIEYPYLWWTNGLGTPNLYEITIQVFGNELIDSYTKRIGIRDLRLIRNHDEWGESFYFLLNGVPIFAKGANWIPIDSFISRGKKKELYRKNLMNAKNANMNMIRVWGGGIYEDDEFYDLCDELGILIWQDFPFACAIYPYNSSFIENVKNEVVQNIKRLRTHASLALWCGNNEIEWLWE